MYVTVVFVKVKKEKILDFIQATKINHESSVKENGNRRFDILQLSEDDSKFILYEAYSDETEAKKHKETSHYLKWRDTVSDWMDEPRKGIVYKGLFPE
ncbi:MAG: antibiotic biosynthesis monooxygenase [Spirochaetia bacterium]|nr:antibiotic biosynthesis monooxygenase [Spirochaetia bacterium]